MERELTLEELKLLRRVARRADDLLEEALKHRENLEQTFTRVFPAMIWELGAIAMAVTTLDEELTTSTFAHGDFGATPLSVEKGWGVRLLANGNTLVSQELDLVGTPVGALGVIFKGDRLKDALILTLLVDTLGEELDTVLAAVQTASEKHQLLVTINGLLSNRVFELGMDGAVGALCERVKIPGFLLLYRDALEAGSLHYRIYRDGQLDYASNARRHAKLEDAIRQHGSNLLAANEGHLREALGEKRTVETLLISGVNETMALGKITVWSGGAGFGAYTMDVLRLLASTLAQRLLDYNRERIHLAQFFSTAAIDELLRDADYGQRYLSPRAEEVGILFADINGFTKICEQVLERPERIGKFVDDWSDEAVRILYRHGGVFDKMVGDCVIGLFGPPFFKSSLQERASAALKASLEIQRFTKDTMSAHPEVARLSDVLSVPGLGVAIGVNLTMSFCGLFGPNRNYTSFSTGMNQTARLQSLGGFRETLVMAPVFEAIRGSSDPELSGLKYGSLEETAVKNVAQPLRYYKIA